MKTSQCKGCDEPIIWAVTVKNRVPIPMDVVPDPAGNLVIENWCRDGTPIVRTLSPAEQAMVAMFGGEDRFIPHHATCPHVGAFR